MRPSKTQERDMLEAPPHFTLRVEQEHRKCEEDVSTRILKPESNVATENDIQIKNIAENKLLNWGTTTFLVYCCHFVFLSEAEGKREEQTNKFRN